MTEILTHYWPLLVGGVVVLLALFLLLRRRGQRVELGDIDSVVSATLARPVRRAETPPPAASDSELVRIKGLGPKVAARLEQLGVVRLDQLAALDADAQTSLDAQLGEFAGRMARDRWVEQAQLLARGEMTGFETQFGKLG